MFEDIDIKKIGIAVIALIIVVLGIYFLFLAPNPVKNTRKIADQNVSGIINDNKNQAIICQPLNCDLNCQDGYIKNPTGCEICACINLKKKSSEYKDSSKFSINYPKKILINNEFFGVINWRTSFENPIFTFAKARDFTDIYTNSSVSILGTKKEVESNSNEKILISHGFLWGSDDFLTLVSDSALSPENIVYILHYKSNESILNSYQIQGINQGSYNKTPHNNEFSNPELIKDAESLAIDGEGNFYFVNSDKSEIYKFDKNKKLVKQVGKKGNKELEFDLPSKITAGKNKIYVIDTKNHRIQILTKDLEYLGEIANVLPELEEKEIGELVLKKNEKIYEVSEVAERNDEVFFFPTNGLEEKILIYDSNLKKIGTINEDYLSENLHIGVNDDYLIVGDIDTNKVHIFDKSFSLIKTLERQN